MCPEDISFLALMKALSCITTSAYLPLLLELLL